MISNSKKPFYYAYMEYLKSLLNQCFLIKKGQKSNII